ncbi:unnamed protein product [Gongylonema pulchrum]|uniref:Secreted protein n=1 Tax=Gongylonema pulchrum TaxID=637853 RepID=A0A183F156_9BILA|nr:unnamed protein product [Gongylonema pulchrum]
MFCSLTALSTSMLCEAAVDERIVCPLLTYLLRAIAVNMNAQFLNDEFLDHLDFVSISYLEYISKIC